jgi:hypothetical protein
MKFFIIATMFFLSLSQEVFAQEEQSPSLIKTQEIELGSKLPVAVGDCALKKRTSSSSFGNLYHSYSATFDVVYQQHFLLVIYNSVTNETLHQERITKRSTTQKGPFESTYQMKYEENLKKMKVEITDLCNSKRSIYLKEIENTSPKSE